MTAVSGAERFFFSIGSEVIVWLGVRRFRSAQAFSVEPGAVEAARASLSGSEHRAGIFDSTSARLGLLGGGNPVDPISARDRRDARPQRPCLWSGRGESLTQICRHLGFWFLRHRRDLEGDSVTCARAFAQLPVQFEPMALSAVWLEHGLKREAIDRAFDRRHAPRGKLQTRSLWQDEKGP